MSFKKNLAVTGLLRAARKKAGMTQVALAKAIGVSQSTLSKVEHGVLSLSVFEWMRFCQYTDIEISTCRVGYIDLEKKLGLESTLQEGLFHLPKKFSYLRGQSNRYLQHLYYYLETTVGHQSLETFLKSEHLDPDYRLIYYFTLNMNFTLKLLEMIGSKICIDAYFAELLLNSSSTPQNEGIYQQGFLRQQQKSTLKHFIHQSSTHKLDFVYKKLDEKKDQMTMAFEPNQHLSSFNYRQHPHAHFFCDYEKASLKRVANLWKESPASIHELECHYQGADRCVYQIQFQ